ncbi:MAG: glycerol-3-phosphate dehydrogenase/oxidase, partial [Gemmatimonadetes bacterium]|nr:glycerol-3-phosphate dehydrogenase/oxidase [Gemmatimonadota bacterium]
MNREGDEAVVLPFSAATRARSWTTLGQEDLDVLIVGAGITGAGIALDCAGRGLRVAFVDAGDLGSGTSSRSSRLIHGGLRYLETFDFRLVFEALAERRRLLQLAPHLVRPLPFLFPVHQGIGPGRLKLGAGMWLYDLLSLFRGVGRHRMLGRDAALEREPAMRTEGLRGGAIYFDAQVDDARLTIAVARAAHHGGAIALPYVRVTGFSKDQAGRVTGAHVRDQISGEEKQLSAKLIIVAAGPWTDEVRRIADPNATARLRITKGVHVVLPRERVGNEGAIIFQSPVDGRIMFILPWGDFTYIGTTDTDFQGDMEEPAAEAVDVEYLLASANELFPAARLQATEVISTWGGVRPLLAPVPKGRGSSTGRTSREHEIWREENGMLCVAGGKLTTYRPMAAEVTEKAAEILKKECRVESGDFYTEHVRLPGAPDEPWDEFLAAFRSRATTFGISEVTASHLASAYGEDGDDILSRFAEQPELAQPIAPELPYTLGEIDYVVANEMALTLDDV